MISERERIALDRKVCQPIVRLMGKAAAKNKDAMVQLGELLYSISYAATDNDDEAFLRMATVFDLAIGDASDLIVQFWSHPSTRNFFGFAAHWADQAFPQIDVGEKYAAALMATKLSDPALAPDIRPPWRAFLLQVPPGLLPIDAAVASGVTYIVQILVDFRRTEQNPEGVWSLVMTAADGTEIWRSHTTAELLKEDDSVFGVGDESENKGSFDFDLSEMDNRSAILATRLVFGLCLAMSDPTNVSPVGLAKSAANVRPKGKRIVPQIRVFRVGKPIALDVRQAIQDFAVHGPKRKGGTLSIQQLVRGHWKPRLGARLGHPVWIEPYYRGPEDAPILMPRRTSKG